MKDELAKIDGDDNIDLIIRQIADETALQSELSDLQKDLKAFRQLEKEYKTAVDRYKEKRALYEKANAEYVQANRLFMDAQAGLLAKTLQDGIPCPVCGSVEHPDPAVLPGEAPTEEGLKKAKKKLDKAMEEANAASGSVNGSQGKMDTKKEWGGHALGTCYLDKVDDRKYVAHLFGENIPTLKRIDTNYNALQNACTELKLTAEQQNLPVAVPGYIGCGLAGGNWEFVYSDILVPTFKDFRPGFTIVYDMRAIKNLWSDFGNVPVDPETEKIEQEWHGFKPGTHREEISHWFEKTFDLSVAEDLMNI